MKEAGHFTMPRPNPVNSNEDLKCYEEVSVNFLYEGQMKVAEILRGMLFSTIPAEGTFST